MSGIFDSGNLVCSVVPACPLYDPGPFFAPVFIIADYYPVYVNIAFWAVSFYCWEFYFSYVGIAALLDYGLNYGLLYIIQSPERFPGCSQTYEMPSYSSQFIMMLNTLGITYAFLWNRNIEISKIWVMNILTAFVLLSRVYIGTNRISELVAGAVIGVVEGFLYGVLLFLLKDYWSKFMQTRIAKMVGMEDHMCGLCTDDKEK